jgi:segregation and condensation protein A
MEEYQYNVSDFKGPLDLLLYLIEKNKVDIYNIPIVEITDQFNAYVNQINAFDVNYASKFFVMAATLLQIKSRHLLPKPPKPESEDEETPEEILVRQLVEYKHMKKISQIMGSLWEKRSCMINRPRTPMHYESRFIGEIDKESLYQAFCVVYQSIEEKRCRKYVCSMKCTVLMNVCSVLRMYYVGPLSRQPYWMYSGHAIRG